MGSLFAYLVYLNNKKVILYLYFPIPSSLFILFSHEVPTLLACQFYFIRMAKVKFVAEGSSASKLHGRADEFQSRDPEFKSWQL